LIEFSSFTGHPTGNVLRHHPESQMNYTRPGSVNNAQGSGLEPVTFTLTHH